MRKLSSLVLLGLFFMIISCEKNDNKPDNEQIIENNSIKNNSAILSGNSIGDNSETIENLWKIGKVLMENESNDFFIDTVFFGRSSSASDYVYWVMPVKNTSDHSYAFIKATGIRLLDIDNNVIYEDDNNFTFVYGSCGNMKNSTFLTNTFLRNNELGYFLGIDKVNFDNVAKIKIEAIEHSQSEYDYSNISLIPTSYQATNNTINVNIKNNSDQPVYVMFSPYIMFDQENRPLYWSYLDFDYDITIMEKMVSSNSSVTMVDYDFFNGTCNKIQPILEVNLESMDFKSATLKKSSNKTNDERFSEMKIRRDVTLNQKRELQ